MRKIMCMALFALIVSQILPARERYSMVFYGFFGQGELSRTADALSDLVRVELVNSRLMTVIDSIIVGQSLAEMENLTQGMLGTEDALETARQLSADFLLIGRVSTLGALPVAAVEMVSALTGSVILGKTFTIDADRIRRTADTIAKEVVNAMIVLEAVTLEDVDSLVEIGRYRDAQALLERFAIFHEWDGRYQAIQELINRGMGRLSYQKAQEYLASYLFDEALVEINQAVSYDPGNPLYKDFVKRVGEAEESFRQEEESRIIETLAGLIGEERYTVAQGLLEKVYERGVEHPTLRGLELAVQRGLSEKKHAREAQVAMLRHDYTTARLEIQEAIRLNPLNGAYGDFMRVLNEQEAAYNESSVKWEAYRGELSSFRVLPLFLDKKTPERLPEFSYLFGSLDYRDTATLEESTLSLKGAAASYAWRWLLPYLSRTGFADLYGCLNAGIRFATSLTEIIGAQDELGYRDLTADRKTVAEACGGASLELVVFSFLLRAGIDAGAGVFHSRVLERSPALDTEEVDTLWAPSFSTGIHAGADWCVTETFRFSFGYRWLVSSVTLDGGWENTRLQLFTLGLACKP